MSSCWLNRRNFSPSKRHPKGYRSYQVLYRRGGRGYKLETAGSFPTEREGRIRRDLVAGWLAAGLDPKVELARIATEEAPKRTYRDFADAYRESRVDVAAGTTRTIDAHLKRLVPIFGASPPDEITVGACIEAVATLRRDLEPSSLRTYWATNRLILDFAGLDPNPARDRLVKLPKVRSKEPVPPPSEHVLAILERSSRKWRLPLVVIEQTAMAVGETHQLEWGDIDVGGSRFRLRRSTVKAQIRSRARWVQVPEWLMKIIAETCPAEDRTETRRVFPGFTPDAAKSVMARACVAAEIPHYHPHDLRHRRISLWHGQGIPARELAARAGHSKPSMSLDVYSHLMPLDEVPPESLRHLLVMSR